MRNATLRTHPPEVCAGQFCVIHNPSEHHMRDWDVNWREDLNVMERTCPHGIGHPDPDDAAHKRRIGLSVLTVHGCDGCCIPPDQRGRQPEPEPELIRIPCEWICPECGQMETDELSRDEHECP